MTNESNLHFFFDTETSGFISKKKTIDDPTQNWCVQIGAILSTKDEIISELDVLIKPNGRTIPEFLTQNVHGISVEQAQEKGIEEVEALELFARMLKDMPKKICHNFLFDNEFLDHMFQRNMDELSDEARSKYFIQFPHFCTMRDKNIIKFCDLKNIKGAPKVPKLEELYMILFEEDFPNAHNALADAQATRKCYYELLKRGIIIE